MHINRSCLSSLIQSFLMVLSFLLSPSQYSSKPRATYRPDFSRNMSTEQPEHIMAFQEYDSSSSTDDQSSVISWSNIEPIPLESDECIDNSTIEFLRELLPPTKKQRMGRESPSATYHYVTEDELLQSIEPEVVDSLNTSSGSLPSLAEDSTCTLNSSLTEPSQCYDNYVFETATAAGPRVVPFHCHNFERSSPTFPSNQRISFNDIKAARRKKRTRRSPFKATK